MGRGRKWERMIPVSIPGSVPWNYGKSHTTHWWKVAGAGQMGREPGFATHTCESLYSFQVRETCAACIECAVVRNRHLHTRTGDVDRRRKTRVWTLDSGDDRHRHRSVRAHTHIGTDPSEPTRECGLGNRENPSEPTTWRERTVFFLNLKSCMKRYQLGAFCTMQFLVSLTRKRTFEDFFSQHRAFFKFRNIQTTTGKNMQRFMISDFWYGPWKVSRDTSS